LPPVLELFVPVWAKAANERARMRTAVLYIRLP
jgi:hypothetical protein